MDLSNYTEHALWSWTGKNPWWWDMVALLGLVNLFRIYRLGAPEEAIGWVSRGLMIVANLLFFLSHWNTGFGLIAPFIMLLAVWGLNEQLIRACLRSGKIKPMAWAAWWFGRPRDGSPRGTSGAR